MSEHVDAPKEWRGRFLEDIDVGDIYRSRIGRTISETDNTWFTLLTCNTNQVHFNSEFASGTRFGRLLVNSCLTLSLVVGLSVPDTSENATANLSWDAISLPNPVFVGDTLWAESEVLSKRPSDSRPTVGIVGIRTRGINQRREVVIEYRRSFMVYRRDAPEVAGGFPVTRAQWSIAADGGDV
jgi:itaconyl-CoA hydratase